MWSLLHAGRLLARLIIHKIAGKEEQNLIAGRACLTNKKRFFIFVV